MGKARPQPQESRGPKYPPVVVSKIIPQVVIPDRELIPPVISDPQQRKAQREAAKAEAEARAQAAQNKSEGASEDAAPQ